MLNSILTSCITVFLHADNGSTIYICYWDSYHWAVSANVGANVGGDQGNKMIWAGY